MDSPIRRPTINLVCKATDTMTEKEVEVACGQALTERINPNETAEPEEDPLVSGWRGEFPKPKQ